MIYVYTEPAKKERGERECKHVLSVETVYTRWLVRADTWLVIVKDDDSYIDTYVSPLSIQMSPNIVGEKEADDVHVNRNDHDEGDLIIIV